MNISREQFEKLAKTMGKEKGKKKALQQQLNIHAVESAVSSELLANWDTAIVDLYRNGGMFVAYDVRLRNCSLHYNDVCNEYYVRYRDVTFGMHDIYNRR